MPISLIISLILLEISKNLKLKTNWLTPVSFADPYVLSKCRAVFNFHLTILKNIKHGDRYGIMAANYFLYLYCHYSNIN